MFKFIENRWILLVIFLVSFLNYGQSARKQTKGGNNNREGDNDKQMVFIIKYMGNCEERINYTFNMPAFSITQMRKNVYVMTGKIDVREDFTGQKMRAVIEAKKCDVNFHTESCQSFIKWPINDLCEFFNSDNNVYGIFLKNYVKRPKCPLKVKTYELTDIPMNMELIGVFPITGVQNYITTFKIWAGKNIVGCLTVQSSLRMKRAKRSIFSI